MHTEVVRILSTSNYAEGTPLPALLFIELSTVSFRQLLIEKIRCLKLLKCYVGGVVGYSVLALTVILTLSRLYTVRA